MAKNAITKKTTTTALANYDAELAKYATEAAEKEKASGSMVSIKGGVIHIAGAPVKDNTLQVVVLDHCYENDYFEGEYDPDQASSPVCFAFGRDEDGLRPHPKSQKPQAESCAACPLNVFGSAEKGNGKACQNRRRLALLSANGLSPTAARDGEVVFLKLPVTSTKAWAFYVKGLAATLKRPPFGVVTEIKAVPDPKTQFKLTYQVIDPLEKDVVGAVLERRQGFDDQLMVPYSPNPEAPAKGAKGAKGKARPGKPRKF